MTGIVFDIRRFAIHDGEGIRTTVFLKGCPMLCKWCQNPEGQALEPEWWRFEDKCIGCGKCRDGIQGVDCPAEAIVQVGREMTAQAVFEKVMEDKVFFDTSGGGVTLSGGDPVFQADFALEILSLCKDAGIRTAIETAMHAPAGVFEKFFDKVDLFIVDIKIMDEKRHIEATGVSNALILQNFEALCKSGRDMLLRIPLVPGYTADSQNLKAIAKYARAVKPDIKIELLNFNPLAASKYRRMHRQYVAGERFGCEEMKAFHKMITEGDID